MSKSIVFIDSEIGFDNKQVLDLGAVDSNRVTFHSPSIQEFTHFISDAEYLCGHNTI